MKNAIILSGLALLVLASPAAAQPVSQGNVYDRMEQLCAASDVDLVGKRLARECRAQVLAEWSARPKVAVQRASEPAQPKLADRR